MVESEVIGKTPSIKLTNLHMLKREVLSSNPCSRNYQMSASLQIRQSQTFFLMIDYQLIAAARIKTASICPYFTL